jgi:uncharacterized protein (TIGR00251 family)
MPLKLTENADGTILLRIKVVPGASRDRIVGELGDELKLAVSKPPQDGAANRAVIALLAKHLGIPKQQITIIRGQTNPHKEVQISGIGLELAQDRLKVI